MSETRITIMTNGPYKLEGGCPVIGAEGQVLDTAEEALWLCRCGQSKNKPYCDKSHRAMEFDGTLAV